MPTPAQRPFFTRRPRFVIAHRSGLREVSALALAWLVLCAPIVAFATDSLVGARSASAPQDDDDAIEITRALVLTGVMRTGRTPIRTDAFEATFLDGTFHVPSAGDAIELPGGGTATWRLIEADRDATFRDRDLRGGWVHARIEVDRARTMMLDASGHSMVIVNGVPRAGDPYGYGFMRLPVALRAGPNDLLFLCGRGSLRARLVPLPLDDQRGGERSTWLGAFDRTLPDVIAGRPLDGWLGVPVVHAGDEPITVEMRARVAGTAIDDDVSATRAVATIPARSIRKIALRAPPVLLPGDVDTESPITLELSLARVAPNGDSPEDEAALVTLDRDTISLRVADARALRTVTFRSAIDGTAQEYGVRPPSEGPVFADEEGARPGVLLALHGASVRARRQAAGYQAAPDRIVVAPMNRRPFGFDWEDWGRTDAFEALADAERRTGVDPTRRWLTGHSMGGHGTWQLGSLFPDRFAAIGPSAGWESFASYGGGTRFIPDDDDAVAIDSMIARASSSSDTLRWRDNLLELGVFILHGDADETVPVREARRMRRELGAFHPDFAYHERPGAGHWWGDQCMDWPPMIEFLTQRSLPPTRDRIRFTTPGPWVSSSYAWARIERQGRSMEPSTLELDRDREARTIVGTTENVTLLALDLTGFGPVVTNDEEEPEALRIELDGEEIRVDPAHPGFTDSSARLLLARETHASDSAESTWRVVESIDPTRKHPARCGPLKQAFGREMVFVVGTGGDDAHDALLASKARFDAEQWWYRGNGSVPIVRDVDLDAELDRRRTNGDAHPNLILYGTLDTNAAMSRVDLGSIVPRAGEVGIGDARFEGDDLLLLAIRPIAGEPDASAALIAPSGDAAVRLSWRMPIFVSGAGFPDIVVVDRTMLVNAEAGVRAAGFFGPDWSLERGEVVTRPRDDARSDTNETILEPGDEP